MKARIREMEANLVQAEAEVPMAISESLANGKLGILDYYKMKNVIADTEMRQAIAGSDKSRK
jgi:uncharacterized protein YqfA (UPF0365 family)